MADDATPPKPKPPATLPLLRTPTLDLPTLIATAIEKGLDPVTLQALLTMYNEQQALQNKEALNHQMSAASAEIEPVVQDAVNKHLGNRYATHNSYMTELRPILQRHSLRLGFEAGPLPGEPPVPDNHVRVRIVIGFGGYAERSSYLDEPVNRQGSQGGRTQMTEQQAIGSALTYAQRNLLRLAFNLTVAVEDDDGEASRGAGDTGQTGPSQPSGGGPAGTGNGDAEKIKSFMSRVHEALEAAADVAAVDAAEARALKGLTTAWPNGAPGHVQSTINRMVSARRNALPKPADPAVDPAVDEAKLADEIAAVADDRALTNLIVDTSQRMFNQPDPARKRLEALFRQRGDELRAAAAKPAP